MNTNSPSPSSAKERSLPLLRRDIKIYKGPNEPDGSPTFNCLDPIRAQYFKISWMEMAILTHLRPNMTLSQLTHELNQTTTLRVTAEEVKSFFDDASHNHLLDVPIASESLLKEAGRRKMHPIIWTLYLYLYVRIPILNPDHFLARTLYLVRPLVSIPALLIYFALTISGLVLLVNRFDEFLNTFPYFFNLRGVVIYGLAITVVKVIHEFSHAYVAKFYRLHIPTMGIALIVLWPVLYTDVTDGWKLSKRSQRLAISIAGVAVELVLAGLCTLGWAISEPGLLQSVFFVVSSATWLSTLLVNLNPAMRFDGYYLMSDLIGIDNLQPRAFAYTRWQFRKWLLGMQVPPPEEGVSRQRGLFMVVYSLYTWIYRLILYTAIAVFVYYEFTKALGIILFMVEIAFFIAPPFFSEARQLYRLSPYLKWNFRSILTSCILVLIATWFVVPLPHRERFAAVTIPMKNQVVYVPLEGKIEQIFLSLGKKVQAGDPLVILSSEPVRIGLDETLADINTVQAQIHVLSLKDEDRALLPEKASELATYESKLKVLQQEQQLLTMRAALDGVVYEWDETLLPQEYVAKNQVIAKIAPLNNIEIMCYVPEERINDIQLNEEVTFRLSNNQQAYQGRIIEISKVRQIALNYPPLSSTNKGEIPVMEKEHNQLDIVESYFAVRIRLDHPDNDLKLGERGHVFVKGVWRSLMIDFIRYVQSIYWRESGL